MKQVAVPNWDTSVEVLVKQIIGDCGLVERPLISTA
ncbi:hypothetical protein MNBD_BACTEROID01-2442 [hydrothermal vent metagenome]|uniref:Uncharacterized protein n=1 Tax=hydrothermal vent metagenome TaxID=652676 RepID=A0A3B0U9B1_9ZZZZ